MAIDDDIEAFHTWATKLGCPPDAIPSEDALRSLFKSRQRDFFCNLMLRVRPIQEVKEIENNILINKIEKIKDQIIPTCERPFLPKQLQIYLTLKDLRKKAKELQEQLDERKSEYEELATSLKIKCAQKISLENKYSTLEAKVLLLEFKAEQLDQEIAKEKKNKAKIFDAMPVLVTDENSNESAAAMMAVKRAIQHLEEFYAKCDNNSDEQSLAEAEQAIWEKMRETFANIPRFQIFNAIMEMKNEQLQYLISLSKTKSNENLHLDTKEAENKFNLQMLKAKAHTACLVARYLAACKEHNKYQEKFLELYPKFEEKLLEKLEKLNINVNDENNQSIIGEYIVQYNAYNYTKGVNEFIQQHVESFKAENQITSKHLANHQVLLNSVKKLYNEINISVNRMQYGLMQMSQIKDKIIHSKNLMKQRLRKVPANSKTTLPFNMSRMKTCHNFSMMSGDTFELSNDDVLCSTKLDLDATMMLLNTSITHIPGSDKTNCSVYLPSGQFGIKPLHKMELKKFYELPLEHLNCIPKECLFYLSPNPLLLESNEVSPIIQLAPGILCTPHGVLQEVQNRIKCADLIAAHSNELKFEIDIHVDEQSLRKRAKEQHDKISELLDKIDAISESSLQYLRKSEKLYDFLMENPLRFCIPAEKKFNNQSYTDYEAEYVMYYRMAMKDPSIV